MEHNYQEYQDEPADNILARISAAALEQQAAELKVAQKEEELKQAQAELRHISEHVLPELMDEAEQEDIRTKNGIRVKVQERIRASIPANMKGKAWAWLKEHGHDSLIKNQFQIDFGRDQEAFAEEFEQWLKTEWDDLDLNVKRKSDIHNMTLVSFIKEQLEEGVALPLDVFGVHRQRFTKLEIKE